MARTRRNDPDRKLRIARAALSVVAERGLEGLTVRAVAEAADVPLGSTTYHYASSEGLIEAALEMAIDQSSILMRKWLDSLPPDPDLPYELAARVVGTFGDEDQLREVIVRQELYMAAMRRPNLRAKSVQWSQGYLDALSKYTDGAQARALALMCDGLVVQSLIAGFSPSVEECAALFRRVR